MDINRRIPIIKAVGDWCNLRCTYCFYSGADQKSPYVLSLDLLESFLQQYFLLFSGDLRFVWHGGEPLLAGMDFYEEVLRLQRIFSKSGDTVENMIQTNATLITDSWAAFLRENKFHVGVSIDGCRKTHNGQRFDAGGNGSFDQVIRGLDTLRRNGITPGVIQTVIRSGVKNVGDDFRFFVDERGFNSWALNLFMEGSSQSSKIIGEGLQDDDVFEVHSTLLKEWMSRNDEKLCIREIENIVAGATGHRAKSCSFNGTCASYFCLDDKGMVWPCDRLSSDKKFLLGDLRKQKLSEILKGPASMEQAVCAAHLPTDCVECRWKSACNNGCTAMRDSETKKYVYCKSRQKTFEAVENLLLQDTNDGCLPA